jgi:hypothetical protein
METVNQSFQLGTAVGITCHVYVKKEFRIKFNVNYTVKTENRKLSLGIN